MHFYYFLCNFTSGFTVFPHLLCRLSALFVAHPGARTWCHAFFPWWALRCLLFSRTASNNTQKYLDYDNAFPPKESNLRIGPCWARDGVYNIGCSKIICICQPSRRSRCMLTLFARRLSRRCTKAFVSEICYHSSECSRVYHS